MRLTINLDDDLYDCRGQKNPRSCGRVGLVEQSHVMYEDTLEKTWVVIGLKLLLS